MARKKVEEQVSRISVSLPPHILRELDGMVAGKGYVSRSQAIQHILHEALIDCRQEDDNEIMAGVIVLFYNNSTTGLQQKLADMQYENLAEVISSLHVNLIRRQTLEVVLVQGRVAKLREIANRFSTLPGVISGRMHLIASLIPPLQEAGREALVDVGDV